MRLTQRDQEILHTIYRYDGVLSVDQIHRWFFGAKRRAYYRLQALCQYSFLQRLPMKELYRVPEPIVWLDKEGAIALADYLGTEYSDLSWRSQPRWSKVSHDLALNEFRYRLERAFERHSLYELETWQGQDELERLLSDPLPYLDYQAEKTQKRVRPDGYFCIRVMEKESYRLRFFVELDNNTESNRRFGRDKVSPNIHLLRSEQYHQIFGGKSGRFLVVTVGSATRFHNLRSEVTQFGGAAYFLFTRSEDWKQSGDVLHEPLLYLSHLDTPFSFETYHTPAFQNYLQQSLAHVLQMKTLY